MISHIEELLVREYACQRQNNKNKLFPIDLIKESENNVEAINTRTTPKSTFEKWLENDECIYSNILERDKLD